MSCFDFTLPRKYALGPWRAQSSQCPLNCQHRSHSRQSCPSGRPLSLSPALAFPKGPVSAQRSLYLPHPLPQSPEPSKGGGRWAESFSPGLCRSCVLPSCSGRIEVTSSLPTAPHQHTHKLQKHLERFPATGPSGHRKTQVDSPTDGPGPRRPLWRVSQMCFQTELSPLLPSASCLGGLVSECNPEARRSLGSNCHQFPASSFWSSGQTHWLRWGGGGKTPPLKPDVSICPEPAQGDGNPPQPPPPAHSPHLLLLFLLSPPQLCRLGQPPPSRATDNDPAQRKQLLSWHLKILTWVFSLNRKEIQLTPPESSSFWVLSGHPGDLTQTRLPGYRADVTLGAVEP